MGDRGFIKVFDDGGAELPDGRFVFNLVPTLQELASCKVALKIWYDFIGHLQLDDRQTANNIFKSLSNGSLYYHPRELNEFIGLRRTPRLIEQMIKRDLTAIIREINMYVDHINFEIINTFSKSAIKLYDPKYLVWSQSSKIDYERTALKIIRNAGLTPIQKFIIMSEYCLEYEFGSFSLSDLPEEFIEETTFRGNFLVFYWICHLKNELDKIPLGDSLSINAAMAVNCQNKQWLAFEYFWNRLGPDDQVSIAAIKLPRCKQYQKKVISKMSKLQQQHLFVLIPDDIVLNFWNGLGMREIAFAIWLITRNSMSEDRFVNLLMNVLLNELPSEDGMRLLGDVWNSAPGRLKDYCTRRISECIVMVLQRVSEEYSQSGFKFLLTVLPVKDEQAKKEMIQSISNECCHVKTPHSMMKFIRLCLPSDGEMIEFKKSVMNSPATLDRCIGFLNKEKFDRCYELFDVYSPDSLATCELMQRILRSRKLNTKKLILNRRKWDKLSEFVDKAFSGDLLLASGMKKQFLSTFATNCPPECYFETDFNEVTEAIEQVLVLEELTAFKQSLLDVFRQTFPKHVRSNKINLKFLNDFIFWCVGDEMKVNEFKKTIPIDDIFEGYFKIIWDCHTGYSYHPYRSLLEPFLENVGLCLAWYFNSVEEVKMYKMHKIYETEWRWLPIWVGICSEQSSTVLLRWFFDNDEEAIRKFNLEKIQIQGL